MKTFSKGVVSLAATVAIALPVTTATPADASVHRYKNCTALHRVYKHGVGLRGAHDHVTSGTPVTNFARRPRVYWANKRLDRDHDHIACESH